MTNDRKSSGGCMCGAIRFEVETDTPWNTFCHCESCRKHSGAPVTALVTCKPGEVRWTKGERARYESSPDRFRGFCRDCGTSLTWEGEINGSWMAIHVSTMDYPENFEPIDHVFCDDAISWFELHDGLPRYNRSKHIEPVTYSAKKWSTRSNFDRRLNQTFLNWSPCWQMILLERPENNRHCL